MIQEEYINNDAEKRVLSKLLKEPNIIFDLEGIRPDDFYTAITRNIFTSIKEIATSNTNINDKTPIDTIVLEEKIASSYPEYYKSQKENVKNTILQISSEPLLSHKDLAELLKIVLNNSIRRKYIKKLEEIKKEISQNSSPDEISSIIECSTLDFTTNLFRSSDISFIGADFESWLANKQNEVKSGNVHIGIKCGFPNYEMAIGGGFRNGTISIIAARAKMGKSFLGLTIADNVAKQGIPVLYLDTELDNEYQTVRRVSKMTKIPMMQLESGKFFGDTNRELLVKNAIDELKKNTIYYITIKGATLEEQVSIIRRFFAKIVGKKSDGKFNKCLVILDYLKLMNSSDKNNDAEYEALGYRMTALHDLMSEYQSPMLAFAQQNRDGLEKEDERTISGSDRIIWLCDSFTIFSKLDEMEVMQRQASVANDPNARKVDNAKLKVVNCRQGQGTPGKKFIGVYCDIHDGTLKPDEVCGVIDERSVQTTIISK